jgi:hypothetical protein
MISSFDMLSVFDYELISTQFYRLSVVLSYYLLSIQCWCSLRTSQGWHPADMQPHPDISLDLQLDPNLPHDMQLDFDIQLDTYAARP